MTEIDCIRKNRAGELPDRPYWEYVVLLGDDSLVRATQIVTTIALQSLAKWPSDAEWRDLLPNWFLNSFKRLSLEEAQELLRTTPREKWSELPWDFGSWVDAIRERGWRWWSVEADLRKATIRLSIQAWPASLEAFEHILAACDARIISRHDQV